MVAQPDQQSSALSPLVARVIKESLELLEWPALCSQVAAFASTSLAARHITQQGLALGNSEVSLTRKMPSLLTANTSLDMKLLVHCRRRVKSSCSRRQKRSKLG